MMSGYGKEFGMQRVIQSAQYSSLQKVSGKHNAADGFSLIEMMIALFIVTVAVLGLLDLTITSIRTNMQNDMRNTSIRLTSQTAEILLAQPIDSISTCGLTPDASGSNYNSSYTYSAANICLYTSDYARYPNPNQTVRNGTVSYNIHWLVSSPTNDIRQITITVSYSYRGQPYSNKAETTVFL